MEIFRKDLSGTKMSAACSGTALELTHNLPSSAGSGCVWWILDTLSPWALKVTLLVLILVWAQQLGFHQVSAISNGPGFHSHHFHNRVDVFTPALDTRAYFSKSAMPPMEHMALHLNLGLVTKGGFALPKASPGDAKAVWERLGPVVWFLSLWPSLPASPGLFFFFFNLLYSVNLSQCEI